MNPASNKNGGCIMQKLIIARITGGIGNQLFIYAAARRLALANDAELVLDDISGFAWDSLYQRHYQLDHFSIPCRKATAAERLEPWSRPRRAFKRWWSQRQRFDRRHYLCQELANFDQRLLALQPRGTLYLEGYWQSEDYFKDVAATLRQDLRIQPPTDAPNRAMAAAMQQRRAVSVHVRFFDEPAATSANNVPMDYYHRAIAAMEQQAPDAHYYLFSDRPAAARARIPLPDKRITLVSHNQDDTMAYGDLWLMTQCQHFIIANSTFSWWGAWLSEYDTKRVLYPDPALMTPDNAWRSAGMFPAAWVSI